MMRAVSILIGGQREPWEAVGFGVDDAGVIGVANGALRFVDAAPGIHGIELDDVEPCTIGDVVITSGQPGGPSDHPNGAFELDHLVIVTPTLDATSHDVATKLAMPQKRVRETAQVRQAFHRFGRGGIILELVENVDLDRAALFGVVFNVGDLDAFVEANDRDVIGVAKCAVQPGRRIATFRSGAGLGVACALMTPDSR